MAGSTQALSLVMCLAFFSQEKMCAQAFTTHLKKTAPVVRHRQQHELLSTARGGAPPVDSDSSKLLAMIKDQTTTASSPASHDSDRGNEWKKGCLRRSRRSRWRYALDVSAGSGRSSRHLFDTRILTKLRGGSTVAAAVDEEDEWQGSRKGAGEPRDIKVLVATTKISTYVDARGEVTARSDWTIGRLREELEQKFPGKIPASVQRLFKGTQLLPSSMTVEEVTEGAEGPLSLLLDNAPPIDPNSFDPDTSVPSRRDGQVEAFSACLAAQSCLQQTLLATMRGNTGQENPELTHSVNMKADFENTQELLKRTMQEVPDFAGPDPHARSGVLHDMLRPIARSMDVNWVQSAQFAVFAFVCARFGARGFVREMATLLLIPLIVLAQSRPARLYMKLARNVVGEIPVLAQLFLGLMQAPGQVILSLNEAAYLRELYGPGGPKIDPAFAVVEDGHSDDGSVEDDAIDSDGESDLGGISEVLSDDVESSDSS